jgi:hypothetical protein
MALQDNSNYELEEIVGSRVGLRHGNAGEREHPPSEAGARGLAKRQQTEKTQRALQRTAECEKWG